MRLHWSDEFDRQLTRYEDAASKSDRDQMILDLITAMLSQVRELDVAPIVDTAMLKRVSQSGRHLVWRQSHPYEPGIALRLICWFPGEINDGDHNGGDTDQVVVALFSGDKASMGDVFYDSVGSRADQMIDQWLREQQEE